jgi:hypothetical protein
MDNITTYQVFIAIGLFLLVTFILIKSSYKRYEKEYGKKTWKLDGSRTGYLRVLVLLSITITIVLMLILKNTILH